MSQTVITSAFEQLKAQEAANGGVIILDEFVFANIPNLDMTSPIDRGEGLPDAALIVHRQAVGKTGMVNKNAVVYSVVMGADVGDFDFNWVGLVNSANNLVAMIVHAPTQKKIKTATGQQGNVLTRSFLMEYNGASEQTQIITPADTWQIDFTARLNGVDEQSRKENLDIYGDASFLDDGFLVQRSQEAYSVSKGIAYVGGIRTELKFEQTLNITKLPVKVWVDVCWQGTLISVWESYTKIVLADNMEDYFDKDTKHYVSVIAEIDADGKVIDLRSNKISGGEGVFSGLKKKQPLNDILTALSELQLRENTLPYFKDKNTAAQTSITEFTMGLLAQKDSDSVLNELGLVYSVDGVDARRSIVSKLSDYVSLHDYWLPEDGDDYSPALTKCLLISKNVLIPPTGEHLLKSTVSIPSGARISGMGANSILSSPKAISSEGIEIITGLMAENKSDIVLDNLTYDGGCNANVIKKRAIRGIRFINCSDIRITNCEVSRCADWALSFEKCQDIKVVNYRHRKSGGTLYGGRDGIHFLDCVNFTLNGADIESGDDMVSCTTETRDQRNAVIRNVIGYSMLASGVIFNEERATTFSTVDILVDGVTIKSGKVVRDVVRVQAINDATNVTGVTVQNIKGTGYSHGVFISGKKLTRVSVSDVDVVSTQSHGVYINGAQNMRASGMGVSQAAAFDGWNITNCSYFDASPRSLSSQGWGVQVLNCANFTLNGNCYNNGAGLFAAANGGNGRINGCSNYNATGVYVGGSTTSYYGLFNDETPTGRVDPATVCNGYIPRNRPRNLNALRDPYAACSFGQTVSGSILLQGVVNCSVELVSDGRYRINFTTPFESTFYRPEIVAQIMNQDLIVRPIIKEVNYFIFEIRNSSGPVMANFILCEFRKAI